MKIIELLNNVDFVEIIGDTNLQILNVTGNSKETDENSMFVAIRGFVNDGHSFIPDVISKNVQCIVVNEDYVPLEMKNDVTVIRVKDTRLAYATIVANFYDNPSQKLKLAAITGTKGKTTTAFYIKSVFENANNKTALLGTIINLIGEKKFESKLTTPESKDINNFLFQAYNEGCRYGVMEVSSHALELNRTASIDFDFAVFTNFASDHMDFHKTSENYFEAKKKLFTSLKRSAFSIINIDDEKAGLITDKSASYIYSYGLKDTADFMISDIEYDLSGTRFRITYKNNIYQIETKLIGLFNAYNATAAFAVGILAGFNPQLVALGIRNTAQVPGRFEVISNRAKKVIIDYAHTAESLRQAILAVKEINHDNNPVITVFGCGGDRDATKRPEMGKIASELSDFVYLTSDNPRSEKPEKIINDIKEGINKQNYFVETNRREAIKKAITDTVDNAIILIAGKGHENYQDIAGVKKYFSDKETALEYLR